MTFFKSAWWRKHPSASVYRKVKKYVILISTFSMQQKPYEAMPEVDCVEQSET